MSDRELLEMAAKAAGYDTSHHWNAYRLTLNPPVIALCIAGESTGWNPLEDDGAALRLAAKLRLNIKPGKHPGDGCTVESQRPGIADFTCFFDDKDEQMRRAITHVAAEIGRSKPLTTS